MIRKTSVLRSLVPFLLLLIAILGTFGYVAFQGWRVLQSSNSMIMHSYGILVESGQLQQAPYALMATARSYILTHYPPLKEDYLEQKRKTADRLSIARALVKDNSAQLERLDAISGALENYTATLEGWFVTESGQARNPHEVENFIDKAEASRKKLERALADFSEAEEVLLERRRSQLTEDRTHYYSLLTLYGGTAAFLLVAVNGFLFYTQYKRSQVERKLAESSRRYQLAVQGSRDGIFDVIPGTQKVVYSPQFFDMLGRDPQDEGLGLPDLCAMVHPEDRETFENRLINCLRGGASEYAETYRLQHSSGRWVWVHSRGRTMRDERSNVEHLIGATTDITYLRLYQERVEAEKTAAEKADRAKSAFLAHMSHEIRTPLTAIVGAAQILSRDEASLTDRQRKMVDVLKTSSTSLRELVTGLLDFSRIESGQLTLERREVELDTLLEEARLIAETSAQEKGLVLTVHPSPLKGRKIWADPTRLRQILVNLLTNATKFTAHGSVTVTSAHKEIEGTPFITVEVTDTGIGIPAVRQEAIFERFNQGDSTINTVYGGTGLGLSIARDLAHLMGGSLKVRSEEGQGSTFTLTFPRQFVPDAADDPKIYADARASDTVIEKKYHDRMRALAAGEKKVLVAEDYEANVVVLTSLLEEAGFICDVVRDGQQAVDKWKSGHYDLVLMDVKMPVLDGYSAAQAIRALEAEKGLARTPILCMTAHAMMESQDESVRAGMDDFLSKPLSADDLMRAVRRALGSRKAA